MSMWKQFLASAGIGGIRVDTHVTATQVVPGQVVTGECVIQGGEVAQRIDAITVALVTTLPREINAVVVHFPEVVARQPVAAGITVEPGSEHHLPWKLLVPWDAPVSLSGQIAYLRTNLAVPNARDPTDTDHLEIRPHPTQQLVFEALDDLGFRLLKVEGESGGRSGQPRRWLQAWEFRPSDQLRTEIGELDVVFSLNGRGIEVLLEVERRSAELGGVLDDLYDFEERQVRVYLPHHSASFGRVGADLRNALESARRGTTVYA